MSQNEMLFALDFHIFPSTTQVYRQITSMDSDVATIVMFKAIRGIYKKNTTHSDTIKPESRLNIINGLRIQTRSQGFLGTRLLLFSLYIFIHKLYQQFPNDA